METNNDNKSWIGLPRYKKEYKKGIKAFVEKAFGLFSVGDELKCPCKDCDDCKWHRPYVIYDHLICRGPSLSHVQWIYRISGAKIGNRTDFRDYEAGTAFGDNLQEMFDCTGRRFQNVEVGPNAEAKKFYRLVEEGKKPLYPGCTNFSRLSFMIRLYHLECVHGITESGFSDLLVLIKEAFPEANVPVSFTAAKNIIKDLGLDYQKMHACPNSCMLYWGKNKDKIVCDNCGFSRWVLQEKKGTAANDDPERIISKIEDGKLRHPDDAKAWKMMDTIYPEFSSEIRNVRLSVAVDGFSPHRTMNLSHITWPIVLVNYNLPPWICMEQENLILSTLISGPNSPLNSIDVYMQPLIAELKVLWDIGIQTYDAMIDQNFNLWAGVLWTISDFPGYAMMSGWSTKGKLACPGCHYETCSEYLKHSRKMCYMSHQRFLDTSDKWRFDKKRFNGAIETRQSAEPLMGTEVEQLLIGFKNQFGENNKKKRKRESGIPFKKKSIFSICLIGSIIY
ncbi:uncharacterized protein LOC141714890 [Apium graveolens]|uniref:uncharacterized protein LOC141714890 n=1 Tax=Apium graveolens TaxID=4045 RepID=UPI003D7BD270